mmetsp:Transcript_27207/g.61728  ORF Transcript_27207/g.61728 Transcript_27207/m.61728 type:complete len:99 (+) Transcript_27207:40-336(+)
MWSGSILTMSIGLPSHFVPHKPSASLGCSGLPLSCTSALHFGGAHDILAPSGPALLHSVQHIKPLRCWAVVLAAGALPYRGREGREHSCACVVLLCTN